MTEKNMIFFSLKPKDNKKEMKNYESYKEALDFCFDDKNEINNIGIVGDYGTGKSTIINTYVKNEVDEKKYDVINVSLLTLEDDGSDTLVLLKNIIKQIVQNPKKELEYNILKFKGFQLNNKSKVTVAGFLLFFLSIFFMNTSLLSKTPFLNSLLNYDIPIELFRIVKYFLLALTVFLFVIYLYPKLLSGIKISKFNIASAFNAEVKDSADTISNDEFDYLEYLIYLLRRKDKNLLLIIEDIDRYENLKIFQQLREVNNLLNDSDSDSFYKFIYAVGNGLFSEYSKKDKMSIKEIYQSEFKDNVTKFFDFVVNITPVMDNQNSYEFIKKHFPDILVSGGMRDEDLFMISQYINSPRILIDVVNDYQIMKNMHPNSDKKEFQDFKLLYYTILKSRFFNFYELIHEIMMDLQIITNLYDNEDEYKRLENTRKDEFISLCMLYGKKLDNNTNLHISNLERIWNTIRNEPDFSVINNKHSGITVSNSFSRNLYFHDYLNQFSARQMEYIFSAEEYRKRRGNSTISSKKIVSEIVSLYYKENNELIIRIIKDVENRRFSDPNRSDFSIRELLDIDYIKLGIVERLLDTNDYNMYISNNYLEVNDATFIKSFNLYDGRADLFILKLYDFKTILSKMKLSKIIDNNGLNVYLIQWLHNEKNCTDKGKLLKTNAVNQTDFLQVLLGDNIEVDMNKVEFIKDNISQVNNQISLKIILDWIDNNFLEMDEQDISDIFSGISIKNKFSLLGSEYKESIYYKLINLNIADMSKDSTLIFVLEKIKGGYRRLLNLILSKYKDLVLKDDFKNNEWLDFFNKNIASYISLLNSENSELIKEIYNKVKIVKIVLLEEITDSDFLEFVYENNYYSYNYENIRFIRNKFERDSINMFNPYIEYSIGNIENLFEIIKKGLLINLENPWDIQFLIELFSTADEEAFKDYIRFLEHYNPIAFSSLEALNLSFEKLVILINHVTLYENTFKNLSFIYEEIKQNDEGQIELIDHILENENFNFSILYTDIDEIKLNKDIEIRVYNSMLKNNGVPIEIFEKYVKIPDSEFENVNSASSDKKLKALYIHDKVQYSFGNLIEYDKEMIDFLFEEKEESILQALTMLDAKDASQILIKLENPTTELNYLIKIINNEAIEKIYSIAIVTEYLKTSDKYEKLNQFEDAVISLLTEIKPKDSNIDKIVSLLSNKKGQRTIPIDFLNTVEFLDEKGLTKHVVESNRIRMNYVNKD